MAIDLTIKGPLAEAMRTLADQGFHPSDRLTQATASETPFGDTHVRIRVKDECESGVVRWMVAPPSQPPFPPGTLLYYCHVPNDMVRR